MKREVSEFVTQCDGNDCTCNLAVDGVVLARGRHLRSTEKYEDLYRYVTYCKKLEGVAPHV